MNKTTKAAIRTGLTGALSGAVLGGASKFLGGAKSIPEILKAAGLGGGIGAGMAGGSQLLGSALLGPAGDDEQNPAMKRGAVGGLVGGTLLGGTLAALASRGKLGGLGKVGATISEELPLDNMLTRKILDWAKNPSFGKTAAAAGIGAALGGIPAAYLGGDEGLTYDTIAEEMRKKNA